MRSHGDAEKGERGKEGLKRGITSCSFAQKHILFRFFLFQSSLDRGCFSCECLLIPGSAEGINFWRRRVGRNRVDSVVLKQQQQQQQQHSNRQHELVLELTRAEMKMIHARMEAESSTSVPASTSSSSPPLQQTASFSPASSNASEKENRGGGGKR